MGEGYRNAITLNMLWLRHGRLPLLVRPFDDSSFIESSHLWPNSCSGTLRRPRAEERWHMQEGPTMAELKKIR